MRGEFVVALTKVMQGWQGDKPASFSAPFRSDELKMAALEADVASYYTTRFFIHFNRAAIVPRRLSHSFPAPEAPLDDPNTIKFLNPDPKIFYDLTQLDLGLNTPA
ncbi:hypothetical protein BDN72DRAFT_906834 [Pluteus cervinus]|uniref:Uncharacterized protein n=1 Tax=Pluteus cervinus TaxID=181527 RepID=A0ACD2ZZ29_9AGAR|nr:hypothetical protein BDN72DRAFT_906834 [Pluteus cervinus]